jgi:hypothetical protein
MRRSDATWQHFDDNVRHRFRSMRYSGATLSLLGGRKGFPLLTSRERHELRRRALLSVRTALGSHGALAAKVGVSRKTLERYLAVSRPPPRARCVDMLHSLAGSVDGALIADLGTAFEVPPEQWPALVRTSATARASLESEVHLAVLDAAETYDVRPAAARHFVHDVLGRLLQIEVDTKSAHAALGAIIVKRAAKG